MGHGNDSAAGQLHGDDRRRANLSGARPIRYPGFPPFGGSLGVTLHRRLRLRDLSQLQTLLTTIDGSISGSNGGGE